MLKVIKKAFYILFIASLFASCNNIFENQVERNENLEPVSFTGTGDYYVSFSIQEAASRTVLPDYSYEDCLFNLSGTLGDESEVLLLSKVSYEELISARNVKVKSGTWTFTVDCFDENEKKILSGTSIPVNITTNYNVIQIPMTFIVGNEGSVEINLTFPKGSGIATVASVKAGLFNSPLAAADDTCAELTISPDGENSKVTFTKTNLESGLTKYVKFFIYSDKGVELGHYTEAVIIGDNLTSKKDLELTTLRSANVLTLTLKTNGSTYTGSEKTGLVLKTFPEEKESYPMTRQGSDDTYSATIINGVKYILYDGDYNTKLLFIPNATQTSDGIVDYCDSFTYAANALTNDTVTTSGLGLIVKDNISTGLGDHSDNSGETLFYNAACERNKDWLSLNLEECVAVTGMSWYAICRYPKMVSISFPKNNKSAPDVNTSWGNYCLAALYVNEGVESYDNSSLYPPSSLEYIYLPSTLKSLNCSGLGNCVKLKNIIIPDTNEQYSSDGQIIMSKDGKSLYSWPSVNGDVEIPEGITAIDSGAFCNNTRITSVSLPSTLLSIGNTVFSGCSTLRSVIIPKGVTSIGNSAFSGCSNLKTMIIPEGVTSIGYSAFSSCSNLKSITIPEGVISIGVDCFNECSSLESIEIPASVKTIGQVENLENVYSDRGVFSHCTSLKNVILHEGLEEIGVYTFNNCTQLKTIEYPSTLKKIYDYAFYSSGLTSLNIPDNVEYLGNRAFSNCNQLKTVTIGSGVSYMGIKPFLRCKEITSLTVSSANADYLSEDNCIYTKDKKKLIYWNLNDKTEVKLPEGLEEIGDECFSRMENLISVELPSTLLKVGNSAFYYCKQLTEIIIPDNVTVIGASAFSECTALKNVKLSSSLTQIGSNAFRDCSALESIDLPSGLTTIGSYAFEGTKIKEIHIPGTVTSFGTGAFAWCGLEKVYFEEGITYIGSWWIFWDLGNLTTVYLPKSIKTIYEKSFEGCDKITDVYYGGSESDWAKISKGSENGTLFTATRHYDADYYKSDDE